MSMCKKIQSQGTFSPLITQEESMLSHNKQGIVSILGFASDRDRASVATTSLRRTLSADMSSKKWLSQNAPPSMKKIASSEQLPHSKVATTSHHDSFSSSSSSDGEEEIEEAEVKVEQERLKIWSTIQREKKSEEEELTSKTWSSILLNKAREETSNSILTPYIHPLVKRSKSSLSEKSLEICTESLGSETGSDVLVFSPDSASSNQEEDPEENKEEHVITAQMQEHQDDDDVLLVEKQNLLVAKKPLQRCFPPPLPSLHNMRSHRGEGRLFLEAVPAVPKQNNKFCAQRQDGRLVLTFKSNEDDSEFEQEEDGVMELEDEDFVGFEEDDDYEEEEEDEVVENVMNQAPFISSIHGLASSMMNKPIGVINNRNTRNWPEKKFNKVVNIEDVDDDVHVAHSLPPRPRVTMPPPSVASFNAYEPFWHTPKVSSPLPKPLSHQQQNGGNLNASSCGDVNWTSRDGQQQLVVMRGKNGGYLVHSSKSCKDSRRSFLFWGPHCIAT